jgi:hypothetical protein
MSGSSLGASIPTLSFDPIEQIMFVGFAGLKVETAPQIQVIFDAIDRFWTRKCAPDRAREVRGRHVQHRHHSIYVGPVRAGDHACGRGQDPSTVESIPYAGGRHRGRTRAAIEANPLPERSLKRSLAGSVRLLLEAAPTALVGRSRSLANTNSQKPD